MSDYTKTVDFAAKDALATGDPAKIVKGSEINTELVNVATAIVSKANIASPTFTGTPAAPTATAGDNTTTLATTAFVTAATLAGDIVASRGAISGLVQSNGPVDLVNDVQISAGAAIDSTNAGFLSLPSAIIKQLDAAWAVGTNAGGLDTGSIGNSDYYIWLIKRVDTGVVDALFSLSSTAPTMPASYTLKRVIGWFKRLAGTIVAFTAYETEGGGIELNWNVPTTDINLSNTLTTTRRTDAVKVPLNFSVVADLVVYINDAGGVGAAWVTCPDHVDAVINPPNAENIGLNTAISNILPMRIRTSSAGLIAARSSFATVDSYQVSTMGFTWARR